MKRHLRRLNEVLVIFLCTPLLFLTLTEVSAHAINHVADIGSATTKTSGTSLNVTTSQAAEAGNTIIVGYVTDPAQNLVVTVSDSAGNTYEQAALAVNWGNGRAYIFAAYNVIALPGGSNITITGDQSVAAKAAVVSVFSGLADVNVLDQFLGNPDIEDQTTESGTSPTVGPTGTTTQANELVIGVIGTEGPVGDTAGTWGNSFTAGPRVGTTGGTADTNWTVSLGYRIVSSTGAYTASKSGITARNWAAAIATFGTVNTLPASLYDILLGRPTDSSVTANTIMGLTGEISFEYGTAPGEPGSYGNQTTAEECTAGEPVDVAIGPLAPNTRYYYRPRFRASSGDTWVAGAEYSFHTQRSPGSDFTFTIISDSHLGQDFSNNTPARYEQTTLNVAADTPDFHLDLGDAFIMSEADNQTDANEIYLNQRPYFGHFSHSAPVFLAIGNHENEEGWNLNDTPFSQGLGSIIARKQYFLNPVPDGFYSGNDDPLPAEYGGGLREDYYAWTWGDALFVVLDPFQYTMSKPYGTVQGSGEASDPDTGGDQWNWTLGQTQYNWLKQTLEISNAKFKFVFSHHVVGGQLDISNPQAGPPTYVRGGALAAEYFEWGGYNASDNWEFDTKRIGWGTTPGYPLGTSIHQLMIDNGVSAFFHGHDHQFVHEEIDGIVYQLVPSPGMTGTGFNLYTTSPYVQTGGNLPSPGHLRVTVEPDETEVEYVRSAISGDTGVTNGAVEYSYSFLPVSYLYGDYGPTDCDVDGSDLAEWIANGAPEGRIITAFAANFGMTVCP